MYQDRTVPFFVEAQNECIDLWTSRTDDEAAVPMTLSWGPLGEVFAVTRKQFCSSSLVMVITVPVAVSVSFAAFTRSS